MKIISYIHKGKVRNISLDELKKLKVVLTDTWEKACRQCGKCCFDKGLSANGKPYINYESPCQHLKFISRNAVCTVYSDRFAKCEKCLSIPDAIAKRGLPGDCPYVQGLPYYPPTDNGDMYKIARRNLSRYDDDSAQSGTPTGGTMNLPAEPPHREDLAKPKDWIRRRRERLKAKAGGPVGIVDPREKVDFKIKPSGHALGG
jgi:uncharacterized cysteine cluster protein YcgN (CxxCxxCC family)